MPGLPSKGVSRCFSESHFHSITALISWKVINSLHLQAEALKVPQSEESLLYFYLERFQECLKSSFTSWCLSPQAKAAVGGLPPTNSGTRYQQGWVYYKPQACPRPRREKTKKGEGEQWQWGGEAVHGRREQTVLLVKDSAGCPPAWADAGCWPSQGLARTSLGTQCVASLGFALHAFLAKSLNAFIHQGSSANCKSYTSVFFFFN